MSQENISVGVKRIEKCVAKAQTLNLRHHLKNRLRKLKFSE